MKIVEGNRPVNSLRFQDEMTNVGAEVKLLPGLPGSGSARGIDILTQLSVVQEVYYYCTVWWDTLFNTEIVQHSFKTFIS